MGKQHNNTLIKTIATNVLYIDRVKYDTFYYMTDMVTP